MNSDFTPIAELLAKELAALQEIEATRAQTYMQMGMIVARLLDSHSFLSSINEKEISLIEEIKHRCNIPSEIQIKFSTDGKVYVPVEKSQGV